MARCSSAPSCTHLLAHASCSRTLTSSPIPCLHHHCHHHHHHHCRHNAPSPQHAVPKRNTPQPMQPPSPPPHPTTLTYTQAAAAQARRPHCLLGAAGAEPVQTGGALHVAGSGRGGRGGRGKVRGGLRGGWAAAGRHRCFDGTWAWASGRGRPLARGRRCFDGARASGYVEGGTYSRQATSRKASSIRMGHTRSSLIIIVTPLHACEQAGA